MDTHASYQQGELSSAAMGRADCDSAAAPLPSVRPSPLRTTALRLGVLSAVVFLASALIKSSSGTAGAGGMASVLSASSSSATSSSSSLDAGLLSATVSNEYTRGVAGPSALEYPWLLALRASVCAIGCV